jgi:peptide/nickel transport system substrate-binding protein
MMKFRLLSLIVVTLALVVAMACGADEEPAAAPTAEPTAAAAPAPATEPAPAPAPDPAPAPAPDEMMAMEAPEFTGSFHWDSYGKPSPTEFNESPIWADMVAQGNLPPVSERLPVASDVMVIPVVDQVGEYGGKWRRAFKGPNDGQNADRIMMDEFLKFDLDGTTLIPNLAKGWDISDDGTVYTLHLREGLKWSDGTPMTAEDFVWYNQNVIHNDELNPTREGQIGWSGYSPVSITKADDFTVLITLPEASAGFLDELGTYRTGGYQLHGRIADGLIGPTHFLKTIHRDFADDKAAYDKRVSDAGFDTWPSYFKERGDPNRSLDVPTYAPWKLSSPNTTVLWEFERNPYYWAVDPVGNQLPYIDKISMKLIEDVETMNLRAIAGEIDFQHRYMDLAKIPVFMENADKNNYETLFWPPSHGTQAGVTINNTYGIGDPLDYEPDEQVSKWLKTVDFRIALSHAINRDDVNEVMFLGLGVVKQPVFMKGHPFYPGDEYANKYTEYDPAKSNKILDDLGLDEKDSDGFRLRTDGSGDTLILELAYRDGGQQPVQMVAEFWEAIGVKTFQRLEDVKLYSENRARNAHQIICCGAGGARYPAVMTEWFSLGPAYRNWYTGGQDFYAQGNPVLVPIDPDIKRIAELTDQAKKLRYSDRKDIYQEVQEITIDNLYYIGFVGDTAGGNGVVIKKRNLLNVPEVAPNQASLQNPGIARTAQFFFVGGKNDGE